MSYTLIDHHRARDSTLNRLSELIAAARTLEDLLRVAPFVRHEGYCQPTWQDDVDRALRLVRDAHTAAMKNAAQLPR